MNLYVSNLAYSLTDTELREAFERYGFVSHARIILDRETGRSRGFAFVEMPNDDEARAAINGLNNIELSQRPLKVVEARPREERPYTPRQGGGGGGGNFRNDGGGYKGGGGGGGYNKGGKGKGGRDRGDRHSWDRGKRDGGFEDDWD